MGGHQAVRSLHPGEHRRELTAELLAVVHAELLIERLELRSAQEAQRYSFLCPVAEGASVAPPNRGTPSRP